MPLYHKKRKPLLSSTRSNRPSHLPTSTLSNPTTLSSNHARTLIRQHHVFQKRLAAARAAHDQFLIASLEAQITTLGGLARYQRASLAGQAKTRGGDSSHVLVRWMHEMMGGGEEGGDGKKGRKHKCEKGWRMLEVGALRVDNAAARSGLFAFVERIDLHAQEKGILTQDFMQRPLPTSEQEEGFDVVSLSLVLNYVGDPAARGEMLRRVEGFLRQRRKPRETEEPEKPEERRYSDEDDNNDERETDGSSMFPGLFLVLPAPCVTNSRYLDEERLEAMMRGLGYVRAKRKLSLKLVYYFWRWEGRGREREGGTECEEEGSGKEDEDAGGDAQSRPRSRSQSQFQCHWPKTELPHRKGGQRNNFAVVFK